MTEKLILLVDDDKFLLDLYKKKFELAGAKVEIASSSQDALDKLKNGLAPNVILIDVIMPGVDGIELLETIRKDGLAANAKILMLSNENTPSRMDKAQTLGISGYLVKATNTPSEVIEQVLKVLN